MSRRDSWVAFTWSFPLRRARVITPTPTAAQAARARNVRCVARRIFICEPPVRVPGVHTVSRDLLLAEYTEDTVASCNQIADSQRRPGNARGSRGTSVQSC